MYTMQYRILLDNEGPGGVTHYVEVDACYAT